jgi:hypothetical protein
MAGPRGRDLLFLPGGRRLTKWEKLDKYGNSILHLIARNYLYHVNFPSHRSTEDASDVVWRAHFLGGRGKCAGGRHGIAVERLFAGDDEAGFTDLESRVVDAGDGDDEWGDLRLFSVDTADA